MDMSPLCKVATNKAIVGSCFHFSVEEVRSPPEDNGLSTRQVTPALYRNGHWRTAAISVWRRRNRFALRLPAIHPGSRCDCGHTHEHRYGSASESCSINKVWNMRCLSLTGLNISTNICSRFIRLSFTNDAGEDNERKDLPDGLGWKYTHVNGYYCSAQHSFLLKASSSFNMYGIDILLGKIEEHTEAMQLTCFPLLTLVK